MSLLARFRLEQATRNIRPEGTPDRSQPSTPTHLHPTGSPPLSFPRSSNSPPFPPGQPRRRERSASSEDLEAERLLKRKKLHALDTCRENQLDENALDQFAEFDVPQMLIALQGKLLALERERLQDETQDFIRSHAFKDILKDRLRSCLLSPNLSRYVDGLSEHIWGFIKRNPGVFKLPARALEDPELSDCIDSLIKDILTKQRSQIKFKIAGSITKEHHISQLAKSLAQKDFIDVTRAQWARIAFLRQNMLFFNKLVTESMNKKLGLSDPEQRDGDSLDSDNISEERLWSDTQFWEFIDTLLDELRSDLEQHAIPEIRIKQWEKNFTEALQMDLDMFPPGDKASCLRASDGKGIADWQRAVHQELVWL